MEKQNNEQKNGVKDLIISALIKESPQSVRNLHRFVEKERHGITYHAVHKAVNALLRRGVLGKEKGAYSISQAWVENVRRALEEIKSNYLTGKSALQPGIAEFREGQTQAFTFENLAEADKYRKRLQGEYLEPQQAAAGKPPYCGTTKHLRSPLFAAERALNLMSMARRACSEAYILCNGTTPLDEWCADYYRNEFVKVQTGVACAEACEISIMGDAVVQLYLPREVLDYIDFIYASISTINDPSFNVHEFYRTTYQLPTEVRLVVTRNAEIAEQLRKEILGKFRRDRVAIFDIHDTLVDGFLLTEFAEYFTLRGKFNAENLEAIKKLKTAYEKGLIDYDKCYRDIIVEYAKGLKGRRADEIGQAAKDYADEGRVPLFAHSRRLFNAVNSYYRTIGITKGTPETVASLKPIFPFDITVTSVLEIRNGAYTGKVLKNLGEKGAKDRAMQEWLKRNKISLKESLGFGDSHQDILFLKLVTTPIAVRPNRKLEEIASKNGWLKYSMEDYKGEFFNALTGIIHGTHVGKGMEVKR